MTARRKALLGVLAFALVFAATACGDGDAGGDAGGGGTRLEVTATEFQFAPADLTAPADTPVTIVLTNEGAVEHDLVIEETAEKVAHVASGETGEGQITLPAGTYTFYCSIPGHREAGMEGTLTVS